VTTGDRPGWPEPEPPVPLLRRGAVRAALVTLVVVSFLTLTLVSTCSPRRTVVRNTTTTTTTVVQI
jgi:hypothetical protein